MSIILFKTTEIIRHWLIRILRNLTLSSVVLIELIQNMYVVRGLAVVADLDIAGVLQKGACTINELAKQTETNEESLYRLMRMLASQGIFKEQKDRVFRQNRLSKSLLDKKGSVRHLIIHQAGEVNWDLFKHLDDVVRTGESATDKVLGMNIFDFLKSDPEKNKLYNQAMVNSSNMLSKSLLAAYAFRGVKCIVDVGGGQGELLAKILRKHKSKTGILFDLPHVVEEARNNFMNYGVADRTEIIAGNFFDLIPPGGHLYMMKSILHCLSDDQAIQLLKSIGKQLHPKGKIAIIEPIIQEGNNYSFAKLYDIQMMVARTDWKERTNSEYQILIKQAGLKLNRVIATYAPFSIIEVMKD